MALPKATIERLALLAKLTPEQLTEAIQHKDEVTLDIDATLSVFSEAEITTRDLNKFNEGRAKGETVGEQKGKELAAKSFKEKLGLTTASKEIERIAEEAQTKLGADDAAKEQVRLLQAVLNKKEREIQKLEKEKESIAFQRSVLSELPANRVKMLNDNEHLALVENNLKFTAEGVEYKGALLRHPTTHEPLTRGEAISRFYTDRGLLETPAEQPRGRGKGDEMGAAAGRTLKDIRKSWETANPGKSIMSEEGQAAILQAVRDNPELEMVDDGQ